jgi:hypothetical protein
MKPLHTIATVILWLFVIALGLDLGAGLYEARIVVPLWAGGVPDTLAAGNPYARVAIDAGMRFWAYVTSTVAILAVLAVIGGVFAPAPQRVWQMAAAALELVAVAMTLLYFRPTLVRLFMGHGAGLPPAAIVSTVHEWVALSRVRIVISAVAWCMALNGLRFT